MEYGGSSKVTGIRQIVRLKEILQKWQSVTLGSKPSTPKSVSPDESRSPIINKRVASIISYDSDEESCSSPEPPPDVPKGYLAVYVGPELRRFIIPTSYLSHSLFKMLLEKAAEEYGFDQSGGLTIPCEIETFKYLLKCMENQPEEPRDADADADADDDDDDDDDDYEESPSNPKSKLSSGGGSTTTPLISCSRVT